MVHVWSVQQQMGVDVNVGKYQGALTQLKLE